MNDQSPTKSWPDENIIPLPTTPLTNSQKPRPVVCNLADLTRSNPDDGNTLLGNRFLCRAGGLVFIGSAGIGKSTGAVQMGICWAVGRPCFGIKPSGALKILCIQAENDADDLCEMRDGVLEYLELSKEEKKLFDKNFVCVFESARSGIEFVAETLQPFLEEHSPDLLILDPAFSYLGGDGNAQEVVGRFLRNWLTPALQTHRCGALIVHHTPKQNGQANDRGKVATDYAYAGAGSAEWANWARAVLLFKAINDNGVRELRIAKRFRLGWKDGVGKPSFSRLLQQNGEGSSLFYTELSTQQAMVMSRTLSPLQKVLGSIGILPPPGEAISQKLLVAKLTTTETGAQICGRDKATNEVIPLLIEQGYIEQKLVPRAGKRPEVHFQRTTKQVAAGVVTFDPAKPA